MVATARGGETHDGADSRLTQTPSNRGFAELAMASPSFNSAWTKAMQDFSPTANLHPMSLDRSTSGSSRFADLQGLNRAPQSGGTGDNPQVRPASDSSRVPSGDTARGPSGDVARSSTPQRLGENPPAPSGERPPAGARTDAGAKPNDAPGKSPQGADFPSDLNFKNVGASRGFQDKARGTVNDVFNKLNEPTQKLLSGLNIITTNDMNRVQKGEHDAGLYTKNEKPQPNSIILSEKDTKASGSTVRDIVRHEMGHPVGFLTGADISPEYKAAYEKGLARMPAQMRRDFKGVPDMQRENFADMFATLAGSKTNQISPRFQGYDHLFPEAKDYIKKRFFK